MGTAAEIYTARFNAFNAQRERLYGKVLESEPAPSFARGGRGLLDPHRTLDPASERIASYVRPDNVVIDVGGGPGRLSLPLALRCREVINVDLSANFGEQFRAAASGAGITNARFVQADWLQVDDVEGDIALMASVTYFVGDIVRFISKWQSVTRRRVLIVVSPLSTRDLNASLYRLVFDEELHPAPGLRELVPVLWKMDIYPEVIILPGAAGSQRLPQSAGEAIQWALQQLPVDASPDGTERVKRHFGELFAETPKGFRPLWRPELPTFLVTWEAKRK